ncbi:CoA transferase [Variovorax sp. J31P207]|uniref:CaiB/BaiF CoA transferase family protein n=1 Tax=Variovorax sp. J31P207 TaxID=3053510 RepID=UPI0025779CC9|nr:CoA transferase [Variovorax sp. J31P207]MDM0069987.1 CoA transferase [Variovorax sp. J31P207]
MTQNSNKPGALHGTRVLDLATMIVGPMAAQMLGDMGADVIKVEPPEGDMTRRIGPRHSSDMGAFFLCSNRNKRSVVLDLKSAEGKEVLEALVSTADVVLHSIRTDAASRLGLTWDRLSRINPSLVLCHVKGFADDGAYAGKPAYDDVAQATSGLAVLQSAIAGEPRYVPSIMGDKITAVHAAFAVVSALCHRHRTGEGQEVSVPMFEQMVAFNMIEHLWGESFVPSLGTMGYPPVSTASRRPFRTSDGEYLCVLPYTDQHWSRFCQIVGDPELTADARFNTHVARQADQPGFWNEVGRLVAQRTKAEWTELLTKADVPFGNVNSLPDLLEDPHLNSVGFWGTREHPTEGTLRVLANPIAMEASPTSLGRLPPRLGEHSVEVLRDLGFDAAVIESLITQGVTGVPPVR